MGAARRPKNGEWEKNRREKLNLTFLDLSQLLPGHDSTILLSKVEVLKRAIAYILDLKKKISDLVAENCSDTYRNEMELIQKQLNELKLRNQQLADLLKAAEIKTPDDPSLPHNIQWATPHKWACKRCQMLNKKGKLVMNKSEIQEEEEIKSKENSKIVKLSKEKISVTPKKKSRSKKCEQIKSNFKTPFRDKKNNIVPKSTLEPNFQKSSKAQSKTILFSSQPITLPCTTVSLVLSYPKANLMTVAKSTPIMTTGIQPVLKCNPQLSALGPGTLIMPDGRIVPVPSAPIIVNRPAPSPALIVMQNISSVKSIPGAKLGPNSRPIAPKNKDSTKTTYVVKVPIPTISADKHFSSKLANSKICTQKIKINDVKSSAIVQKNLKKNPNLIKIFKKPTAVKETKNKTSDTSLKSSKESIENTNSEKPVKGGTSNTNEKSEKDHSKENLISSCKRYVCGDTSDLEQSKKQRTDGEISKSTEETCLLSQSSSSEISSQKLDHIAGDNVARQNSSSKNPSTLSNEITLVAPMDSTKSKDSLDKLSLKGSENNQNYQANVCQQDKVKIIETKKTVESATPNTEANKLIINISHRPESNENTLMETSISPNVAVENSTNNDLSLETNSTQFKVAKEINSSVGSDIINNDSNNTPCVPLQESTQEILGEAPDCNSNNASQVETKPSSSCETAKTDDLKKPQDAKNQNDENQELSGLFSSDPKLQTCSDSLFRDADFRDRSLFMPINHSYVDEVRLSLPHSDFSNDLFSSLQVPTGGQHPESISPTAAFLLAFPLVSTSKTSELMAENDGDSQHGTPTTILQIGNIEPPGNEMFNQNSLLIENNVASLQENMKINKSSLSDHIKPGNTKPNKDVDNFSKFQLDITEAPRNENYHKNFKEKKIGCPVNQDNQTYLPCKKKINERNYNYSLHSEVIPPHFQEKSSFDCSVTNMKLNNGQSSLPTVGKSSASHRKCHNPAENCMNSKNHYSGQSQTYNYNTFPNSNDFSLSSTNYFSTTQNGSTITKTSQSVTNLSSTSFPVTNSWSTAIAPSASSGVPSQYCTYPQRSYVSSVSKNVSQKGVQSNFEDQEIKDRSVPSNNLLPKFSNHFNFSNNHSIQDNHIYSNFNQMESVSCKIEHKTKKQKTNSQRGPVNWMTTPDIRPVVPDSTMLPVLPDVMFHPQKEQDFNSTPGISNASLNASNNITSFSVSAPSTVHSSSQSFHHNNHFPSGMDFQLDFGPFPEMACSSKHPKTVSSLVSNQQSSHYSISPSKNNLPLLPHIDSHMIPSTLPTLVGDLALGTTTPMDTFKSINIPATPFNLETPSKKCDIKIDPPKNTEIKPTEKICFNSSERKNLNRIMPDFYQKTQIHQSTNTTSSFLSVSQLVDPVKSDQTTSRRGIKQALSSKTPTNSVVHKRSSIHQPDKQNNMKLPINAANSSSCQSSNLANSGVSKKLEGSSSYQDDHTVNIGFAGSFGNNISSPTWQNNKHHRSSSHYKGSYSAESLIGDHSAPPQDQISDLPVFSMANQYSHTSVVSSGTYTNSDFSHQNMQPLEFHQPHHSNQNCFNFPTHNSHYSSSYNAENDYVSFDTMYGLNNLSSRATTISQNDSKLNRNILNKRSTANKRKEEFSNNQLFGQAPQIYHPVRSKGTTTSLPNHSGTTSLTNFNLSTIFPEINDKRAVQGSNSFHSNSSKHGDNSSARSSISSDFRVNSFNSTQMQQPGGVLSTPQFPPVTFANAGPSLSNFRPQ